VEDAFGRQRDVHDLGRLLSSADAFFRSVLENLQVGLKREVESTVAERAFVAQRLTRIDVAFDVP